jgi:metallothiol transferase
MTQVAEEAIMATSTQTMTKNGVQTTGIDHVVLQVSDLKHSIEFYTKVLGMTEDHGGTGFMFLNCGSQVLGLFEVGHGQEVNAGPELNHMAFNQSTGTFEDVKAVLESHGVAVRSRRGDPRCIYFADPDGHQLQFNVT